MDSVYPVLTAILLSKMDPLRVGKIFLRRDSVVDSPLHFLDLVLLEGCGWPIEYSWAWSGRNCSRRKLSESPEQ
jgi:hypothetical protein